MARPVVTFLVFLAVFGTPTFLLLRAAERRTSTTRLVARFVSDSDVVSALGRDPGAVFRNGRRRIDATYKIQLGIFVVLSLVLVAGLGGTIAASVAGQLGVAAGTGALQ